MHAASADLTIDGFAPFEWGTDAADSIAELCCWRGWGCCMMPGSFMPM